MNLQSISRYMSLILRHKPEVIGITIDEHGWANVEELIQGIAKNNPGFNKEILEEIVQTDNKQRYSFNDDKTLIRANQGHSIPVDVELEEKEPPKILYHGTGEKYIASIDQNGLIPKSRLYVHLSKDVETAKAVGKRHGKEVVYSINSEQMYKDGYKFYLSKNGVWLTKRVPMKYFTDSVSDLCQGIIDKVDTYEKRIKYLGEENKKLKDEHYKDSEMQRMEAELKKAKEDLYRGFPISEKEQEKIREWELKHDAEKHGLKTMEQRLRAGGCCGGRYTYQFVPTSIGTVGEVICSCGEKFTFQDL